MVLNSTIIFILISRYIVHSQAASPLLFLIRVFRVVVVQWPCWVNDTSGLTAREVTIALSIDTQGDDEALVSVGVQQLDRRRRGPDVP